MSNTYLVRVQGGGPGGHWEPEILGPYGTEDAQVTNAERIRDEELEEDDLLFWLDIKDGIPTIGSFDPMFYVEGAAKK